MGYTTTDFGQRVQIGILSPFSDSSPLTKALVFSDWLGAEEAANLPLSRTAALQVPAVSKLRNLLIATLAPLPLVVSTKAGPLETQPTWTSRTDTSETPMRRMANVIEDVLMDGFSVLAVKRGSKGQALQLAHIPADRLGSDSSGYLTVDGKRAPEDEVCVIDAPYQGLLNVGSPTIRGARDIELSWHGRARNPIPLTILRHNNTDTQGTGLEPAEVKDLIDGLSVARRNVNGAIGYLPPGLTLDVFGDTETDFFESARNATTTSIGQLANIRASMLDGTLADSSSETYKNAQGERSAFLVFDLPFYTRAIEDRLSADDIVPAGQSVAFDFSALYTDVPTAPTGVPRED